jgi:NTP pyrophosphatase (non-canonical NTP hydrolase)
MNIFELHEKMTAHLFPAYSSTDERFLALALCGEAGELANMIKKRWRDGVDLSKEIREELADIQIYLELLAKCFGIEGQKLDEAVQQKLAKVAIMKAAIKPVSKSPIEYSGMSYEQASREAERLIAKGWYQNFDRLMALYQIMADGDPRAGRIQYRKGK